MPLPDGLMMMVPTRIFPLLRTPLLGWRTKLRMGLELFRRPATARRRDRSVAEFVAQHYGQEAVDYLAEPLLSGVYGGDPRQSQRRQRAAALRRAGEPLRQPHPRRSARARKAAEHARAARRSSGP